MTYVKTNWKTGDTITADKLNNIENGIASSGGGGADVLIVTFSIEYNQDSPSIKSVTADKTFAEISSAIQAGIPVLGKNNSDELCFISDYISDESATFVFTHPPYISSRQGGDVLVQTIDTFYISSNDSISADLYSADYTSFRQMSYPE